MSWDEISAKTEPCWCAKGTVTHVTEMDDWNRVRCQTRFDCTACRAKADADELHEQQRQQEHDRLVSKAERLAENRYLDRWLSMFQGRSKREVWLLLTAGEGYPALGTFYKHVKEEGIVPYLHRAFLDDLPKALAKSPIVVPNLDRLDPFAR